MNNVNEYKGYEILAKSRMVEVSPGLWEFERYGRVSQPGNTYIIEPGGTTYKTKEAADEALIIFAKKYIDDYLD